MHYLPITNHRSPVTPTIALVLGTRPEAIKLAPVILQARRLGDGLRLVIISTGQQADLLGPALAAFGLAAEYDLGVMQPGQSLGQMTACCLAELANLLTDLRPRLVMVQGDTTSALAGAMAGFYQQIPVAHVEAGLRTGDLAAPFPEEANRQMIARVARLHFAPTWEAKSNLLSEGIDPNSIFVTGNTVVDALGLLAEQIEATGAPVSIPASQRIVLVTAHRRENCGRPLEAICDAVCRLADLRRELHFVFITHPNPAAGECARQRLLGRRHITLLPPLPYLETLRLVASSWLILTDSGGLQEEAPSFGRPVLVLRDRTERTEGLACGAARLVGTDPARISNEVLKLLESPDEYARLVPTSNPYGDGKAAERIISTIRQFLGSPSVSSTARTHAA